MIYARDSSGIWVNLFIPSELRWDQRRVRLRQETAFPAEPGTRLLIEASGREPWTLRLRIPAWVGQGASVSLNGRPIEAMAQPGGYLELTRAWRAGDRVEMHLPMEARWEAFSDRPDIAALVYGPVVLAQQLPSGGLPEELRHEQGPKLEKAPAIPFPGPLPRDLVSRLQPIVGKPLHFTSEVGGRTIEFAPINESWERYSVYFPVGRG